MNPLNRTLVTAIVLLATLCFKAHSSEIPIDVEKTMPASTLIEQVVSAIDANYGGEYFNRDTWNQNKEKYLSRTYNTHTDEYRAIKSLLTELNHPSVRILNPKEKALFLQDVSGSFTDGIGLLELLSIDIDERTERLTVVTPFANTAAAKAGLRSGDQIIAIDKFPTNKLTLSQAMEKIRGTPGTSLTLDINRAGKALTLSVVREAAHKPTDWIKVSTHTEKGKLIGYIQYRFVADGTSLRFKEELITLVNSGVDSIILDLRNNPGGALADSISIADLFLPKGAPIASLRAGKNKIIKEYRSKNKAIWGGALAVIQNSGTASAAELISGSLQANNSAFIVGEKTFGKGLVHTVVPLSDGSALLFHLGRLFLPNDRDILHDMVEPDNRVELNFSPALSDNQEAIGAADDLQFWAAVKQLAI